MLSNIYILLIFAIVFIELTRKKTSLLDFLTFFHLNFFLFYIFPGFVLSKLAEISSSHLLVIQNNFQILIAIYLGYFLVLIGFFSKSATKLAQKIHIKQYSEKKIIKFAGFLLIFGAFSMWIYSEQYGGFSNAISQADAIRAGRIKGGSLVLFKQFFDCVNYASYLFASVFLFGETTKNNLILYLQLGSSIVLTLIAGLMKSSRSSIIRYLVAFILAYIIHRKKIPWFFITFGLIVVVVIILYGDPLFASLSSIPDGYDAFIEDFSNRLEYQDNSENYLEHEFSGDFSFTLESLDTSLNTEYRFRWFSDFILGFTTLIPQRLIPIQTPVSVSEMNTFLVTGSYDFNIPPGFLALGIYSMSWLGLAIICFFHGWLGRYLQTVLCQDKNNQPWISFLYVVIMTIWTGLISAGDPTLIIEGNTVFLFLIFFIFSWCPKKNKDFLN